MPEGCEDRSGRAALPAEQVFLSCLVFFCEWTLNQRSGQKDLEPPFLADEKSAARALALAVTIQLQ